MPAARPFRRWCAALFAVALLTACTTSDGDDDDADTPSGDTTSETTASGSENTASARGVTADTIRIGFSYIDLETLAESGIIRIDHGPYEAIIQALVDDVNANGGINGRMLELHTAKYSPIGNTEQLAACTKLTEDDEVFVVLNGLLNVNNLCIVQQHETALIGGGTTALTPDSLAKAEAPWASYAATSERSIEALVDVLVENDALEGHTIGVYAAQVANQPLIDAAVDALTDAGFAPVETALNDAPEGDTQAANAQDTVIAQRMMDAGVDVVINAGQFIPGASFDAAGFHPSMYVLEAGNIAAAAFTNPLGAFPIVAGLGATGELDAEFETKAFQHCVDVYEAATGNEIKTQGQEDIDGESSGNVAMQIACTTLQIFVQGATAAGSNLTNDSLKEGIESLGATELANTPVASFGPDKFDGQDQFQLLQFDPDWVEGSGEPQFNAVGEPVTLGG
jgi:hypothetical protein